MYTNQHPEIQPDALNEILALRPEGAENCKKPVTDLIDRMKGAVIGRFAGCVLGIPVELYKMADMQALAMECNIPPSTTGQAPTSPKKFIIRSTRERNTFLKTSTRFPSTTI